MARRHTPQATASLAAERLQIVLELGRRVTSILDLERLLPEACRLIADAFDYDMVGINLLDPMDSRRLYQAAAYPPERTLPRTFRLRINRGITGWAVRHGAPRLSNDVAGERLYVPGPGRDTTRSELDVPLKVGQRTVGVLNVESERVNAFAADDVPYLEGLASQLAQAIENARLAASARELAAAEERARLARDLHDETVQALVAIGRQLDLTLLDLQDPARAAERIEGLHDLVDRTLDGVRRLSRNLRPAILEDLGLVPALRAQAADLERLGLRVTLSVQGEPRRLPPAVEYAVFRVAQESLNNVARHAGVGDADLELCFSPGDVSLTVSDRGAGLGEPVDTGSGQGLASMRDRAAEVGGTVEIASRPGGGTTVRLWVPLVVTLVPGP